MTTMSLDEINRRRREIGKRELTVSEARQRAATHAQANDPGFDMAGFLIGLTTGVPIGPQGVTGASIMGMALHQPTPTPDPTPSHSSHSHSSSSSYDSSSSSSSSSYDSGSSSSGGGFDGGGGSSAP